MPTFLVNFDIEAFRIGSYGKTDRWIDEDMTEMVTAPSAHEAKTAVQIKYHSWSDSFQQKAINIQVTPC